MAEKNQTNSEVSGSELVITRVFNAPRNLVFKAWTEPERFAKWWGPRGSTIIVSKLDMRPGGMCLYKMTGPPLNKDMWGKFIYREITAPERLEFINAFADEEGNTIKGPYFDVWPLEILNKLTFTEQDGKTTLVLRGGPINATEEEVKMFEKMAAGMQQGFNGTFEKLDEYLAGAKI